MAPDPKAGGRSLRLSHGVLSIAQPRAFLCSPPTFCARGRSCAKPLSRAHQIFSVARRNPLAGTARRTIVTRGRTLGLAMALFGAIAFIASLRPPAEAAERPPKPAVL